MFRTIEATASLDRHSIDGRRKKVHEAGNLVRAAVFIVLSPAFACVARWRPWISNVRVAAVPTGSMLVAARGTMLDAVIVDRSGYCSSARSGCVWRIS